MYFEILLMKADKIMKTVNNRRKHECKQADFSRKFDKIAPESSRSCNHLVINERVKCLTTEFKIESSSYVDAVAPLKPKTDNVRDVPNECYDANVAEAKKKLRKAERKCLISRSEYLLEYRRLRQNKSNLVTEKKALYSKKRI